MLKSTPYWHNGDVAANSGPRFAEKAIQTQIRPGTSTIAINTLTLPVTAAPRARRTNPPKDVLRSPLTGSFPNTVSAQSTEASTTPLSHSASTSGKENLNPVRASLIRRKEARLQKETQSDLSSTSPVVSVIDLTGADSDTEPPALPAPVKTTGDSGSITSLDHKCDTPWKVGNSPSLLWSVKTISGRKIENYDQIKDYVVSKGGSLDKYSTQKIPPCPSLPLDDDDEPKAGPSGLIPSQGVKKSTVTPIITLSESDDDDTPLQSILARSRSSLSSKPANIPPDIIPRSSPLPPTSPDRTVRKAGRKRRMYTPLDD